MFEVEIVAVLLCSTVECKMVDRKLGKELDIVEQEVEAE